MANPHEQHVEKLLEQIRDELRQFNSGGIMATLAEARDEILAAIEAVKAAILSAVEDLTGGADVQGIADSLSAAAADLGAATDALKAADPTP